jgi:5-methylcytosine-specific restriction protein B
MESAQISELIQRILALQSQYTPDMKDPVIVERLMLLKQLDRQLIDACGPTFGSPGGQQWNLSGDVSEGAGNPPKVAWARLTDSSVSPSATSGWYVVLLFAADGSSCVMSLNQGTSSVQGANKNEIIKTKSREMFQFIHGSSDNSADRGWLPFGGAPSVRLVGEPELRGGQLARSYELGHVDGVVYRKNEVPSDGEIIGHANALLGMLGRTYARDNNGAVHIAATHVLLRTADSQAAGRDTIREHRDVINERGKVVWAKFGSPLASNRVEDLNSQIDQGIPSRAYLLSGSQARMFRADVMAIFQGTSEVDMDDIPKYYRDVLTGDETCFVLSNIEETDLYPEIDNLLCLESDPGKLMTDALKSQTSVFFVREKNERREILTSGGGAGVDDRLLDVAKKLNLSVDEVRKLLSGVTGSKRQMILMGPPGTGKTFVARQLASLLVDHPSDIRFVQFHPSYGYEDFVEGLRPVAGHGGGFEFKRVPGVIVQMAEAIEGNNESEGDGRPRVLIIDEINRANISRVFGELMFLLEYRDQPMKLMLDNRDFRLPDNLMIIGTMNTADRTIRTLDVAMRRRFRFFEFTPRTDVITSQYAKPGWSNGIGSALIQGITKLNTKLLEDVDRHHTIGHSYFLNQSMTPERLKDVWEHEILPLIEDYFFDRPDKVEEYRFEDFWPNV